MALAYNTSSNLASGTGTRSWSHGAAASLVGGAGVVIVGGGVEETTNVTYGGGVMARIATGSNVSGETGSTSTWWIANDASDWPGNGTQTVEITRSGSTAYIATCYTVTVASGYSADPLAGGVNVGYDSGSSTSISSVTTSLTIPNGTEVFLYGGLYSGENALGSITDNASLTRSHSQDFGNFTGVIDRRTALYTGTGAALTTFAWTQSNDDAAWAVVAVSEQVAVTTQTGSFTANAVIKSERTGTFTANAVIKSERTGSFAADAVVSLFTITTYASDDFSDTQTDTWADADIGGTYVPTSSADLDKAGGVGTLQHLAADTTYFGLTTVSALDVDYTIRVKSDKAPVGDVLTIAAFVRQTTQAGDWYAAEADFNTDNTIDLQLKYRTATGTITNIGTAATNVDTFAVDTWFWVRVQAEGTSPTTLRAKLWVDGSSEPGTWDVETTDSTAGLQNPGGVGGRFRTTSSNSNYPITLSWDDLLAKSISGSQTVAGSFTADAFIKAERTGSFTVNAVIKREQVGSFTLDAVRLETQAGSVTADAVVKKTVAGLFTANAVIKSERTGSFAADAFVVLLQTGSFTLGADITYPVVWTDDFNRTFGPIQAPTVLSGPNGLSYYGVEVNGIATIELDGSHLVVSSPGSKRDYIFWGYPEILDRGEVRLDFQVPDAIDDLDSSDPWVILRFAVVNGATYEALQVYISNSATQTLRVGWFEAGGGYEIVLDEPSAWYTVRMTGWGTTGKTMYAKVWKRTEPEPEAWQVSRTSGQFGLAYSDPSSFFVKTPRNNLDVKNLYIDNFIIRSPGAVRLARRFLADAIRKAERTGAFTDDAVIQRTQTGSFTANAVILKTVVSGSGGTVAYDTFTEDGTGLIDLNTHTAEVGGTWFQSWYETGRSDRGWDLDRTNDKAVVKQTGGGTVAADGTYSLPVDFADGYVEARLANDGFSLGSSWLHVRQASGNPDTFYFVKYLGTTLYLFRNTDYSYVQVTTATATSGEWVRFAVSGTNPTTLQVERRTTQGALGTGWHIDTTDNTAENQVASGWVGITGEWDDDFLEYSGSVDDFLAVSTAAGGIALDAFITATVTGSFTTDAIIKREQTGSLTADAVVHEERTGSFALDAAIATLIFEDDFTRTTSPGLGGVWQFEPDPGVDSAAYTDGTTAVQPSWTFDRFVGMPLLRSGTIQFDLRIPANDGNSAYWIVDTLYDDIRLTRYSATQWTIQSGSGISFPFTFEAGAWYTLKANIGHGSYSSGRNYAKVWKVGDPEPAWQANTGLNSSIHTEADTVVEARSPFSSALLFDNFKLWTSSEAWYVRHYVTADALVQREATGSFTADAVIKKQIGGRPYRDLTLDASPLAYWRLGESVDGAAVDEVGDFHGNYEGSPTFGVPGLLTGDPNTAVDFSGASGEYVLVNDPAWPELDAVTVTAWFEKSSGGPTTQDVVRPGGGANDWWLRFVDDGTKFEWRVYFRDFGGGLNGGATVEWTPTPGPHFAVGTYDAADSGYIRLYIDGEFVSGWDNPAGVVGIYHDAGADIGIGSWAGGSTENFNGVIDEVAVFDYALTATDIEDLWLAGAQEMGGPVSFSADAWFAAGQATVEGSFSADAVLLKSQTESLTVDAVTQKTASAALNTDAVVLKTASQQATADAIVLRAQSGSFVADALTKKTASGSVTTDAVIFEERPGSLTADAVRQRVTAGAVLADAIIARTQTGSFTTDAVIKSELTGSFAADAVIMPTFVADAVVRREQTGSVTADAVIMPVFRADAVVLREQTGSFAADAYVLTATSGAVLVDAVIKAERTGTFAADAIKRIERAGTFTADALRSKTATGSFTADAIVQRAAADALSADAVVLASRSGAVSADAAVLRAQAGTLTADAVIADSRAGSFVADAVVRQATTGAVVADAVVRQTRSFAATADGVVRRVASTSLTTDAIVNREQAGAFAADAAITTPSVSSFTADALKQLVAAGSFTADAAITGTQAATFAADAVIMPTFAADAVVLRTQAGAFTADAVVMPTFSADAVVQASVAGSFTASAYVLTATSGGVVLDAIVFKRVDLTFATFALIRSTHEAVVTADAVILAPRTGTVTSDAVVHRTTEAIFTTDAVLQSVISGTFTADAAVSTTSTGSFTASAVLQTANNRTFTASAVLATARTSGLTADAVFLSPFAGSFTADAVVTSGGALHFITADAVLRATLSGSLTADAVTRTTGTGTFTADAYMVRVTTGSLTADAVVHRVTSGSLTADATLATSVVSTVSLDAVLLKPRLESVVADAVLLGTEQGQLTSDALVLASFHSTFAAGAWLQRSTSSIFTADAVVASRTSFTLDAIIRGANEWSFTASAVITRFRPASTATLEIVELAAANAIDEIGAVLRVIEMGSDVNTE